MPAGTTVVVEETLETPQVPEGFTAAPEQTPTPEATPTPNVPQSIEAVKAEIQQTADQEAIDAAANIKKENQEELDEELELIKKNPKYTRELLISLRDEIAEVKIKNTNLVSANKVYESKLEELYKEKAQSKWDDDMIVVPEDARTMWFAISKYLEHPDNSALQIRAVERIVEYLANIKQDIDIKEILNVVLKSNIEKPNTVDGKNPIDSKTEVGQFNPFGMSQVELSRPRGY